MTSSEAIREEREMLETAEANRQRKAGFHKFTPDTPNQVGQTGDFYKTLERVSKLQARERVPELTEPDPATQERLLNAAKIPARHAGRSDFSGAEWKSTLDRLTVKLGTGFIVALIGLRGVGKTQIGCELIRGNTKRCRPSLFASAMDIFLSIKSSYRRDASTDERAIVEEFCKPWLLVVDEIQERAESPWEDRILTHIINRRYNDEKDTLLIGNITKDEFCKSMGSSIVSRLNETGGLISCEWEGYR